MSRRASPLPSPVRCRPVPDDGHVSGDALTSQWSWDCGQNHLNSGPGEFEHAAFGTLTSPVDVAVLGPAGASAARSVAPRVRSLRRTGSGRWRSHHRPEGPPTRFPPPPVPHRSHPVARGRGFPARYPRRAAGRVGELARGACTPRVIATLAALPPLTIRATPTGRARISLGRCGRFPGGGGIPCPWRRWGRAGGPVSCLGWGRVRWRRVRVGEAVGDHRRGGVEAGAFGGVVVESLVGLGGDALQN
jgi:hypothetical protein